MAEEDNADSTENVETKKPSLLKKLLFPALFAIAAVGVTVGALHFMGMVNFGDKSISAEGEADAEGESEAEADEGDSPSELAGTPAFFFSFYPDMLVNFTSDGQAHYLKLTIDVMSRDEDAIKGVEEYHSILRNNILKLFQQVKYETVKGQEGMESMQSIALAEIKRVLKSYHGNNDIEGVYFTSFVVQ